MSDFEGQAAVDAADDETSVGTAAAMDDDYTKPRGWRHGATWTYLIMLLASAVALLVSFILSADTLLVAPDESMLLVHIVLPDEQTVASVPRVAYEDDETLALRLSSAIDAASAHPARIAVELPGTVWEGAGEGRSAQHFAITLLDALCTALSQR